MVRHIITGSCKTALMVNISWVFCCIGLFVITYECVGNFITINKDKAEKKVKNVRSILKMEIFVIMLKKLNG